MNTNMLKKYSNYKAVKESDEIDKKQKVFTQKKKIWNLLHSSAAYLPKELTKEDSKEFKDYVLSVFYFGKKDMGNEWNNIIDEYLYDKTHNNTLSKNNDNIDNKEINNNANERYINNNLKFNSREDCMLSLCHIHNFVNYNLDKDQFPCKIEYLERKWGKKNDIL